MTENFSNSHSQEKNERREVWRWSRRRAASDFVLLEDTNSLDFASAMRDTSFKTRRASVSETTLENNFCISSGYKVKRSLLPASQKKFELPYYAPRTSSPKSLFEQVGLIKRSSKICKKYFSKLFRQPQEKNKLETCSRGNSSQSFNEDHSRGWSQSLLSCNHRNLEELSGPAICSFQQNYPSTDHSESVGVDETRQVPERRSPVASTWENERQQSLCTSSDNSRLLDWLLRILSRTTGQEITRQVVGKVGIEIAFSMLPLIVWFLVFNFYPYLSVSWRPAINTSLLPKLEGLLHFPYRWFATRSSKAADFIAAVPYTIHAILPGMFFLYLLFTEGRKPAFCFFASLGVLNTSSVLTQILFPFAPPWYFELNGLARAEHWMSGNPGAALSRVDKLFGIIFYQETYTTQNRIPFGSFPSLHAAWPSLIAFCFPARGSHLFKVLAICYVCLIYWAAMYLQHHYVIDLVGGTLYAYLTYRMVFARKLNISSLFYRILAYGVTEKDLTYSSGRKPPLQPNSSKNLVCSTTNESSTRSSTNLSA